MYAYLIFHHRANLYLFNIFLFCFNVELTVGIFFNWALGMSYDQKCVNWNSTVCKKTLAKNETHTKKP